MPEQNSQNPKAFDPASFSMPDQPSLTYSVIANTNQPELSCYVQTVFHRMQGTDSPEVRLSDQAPPAIRTTQDLRPARQDTPAYSGARNWAAQQAPAAPIYKGNSNYQRSSIQFNLRDRTTESPEVSSYQTNQNQLPAPSSDRSTLPNVPRTNVDRAQKTVSSAPVLDASPRKVQEKEDQIPVAGESQVLISKTKLVSLRKDSAQTETPQRDQNTIAKKPEFLKREAFSNKFTVTPSGERELAKAKTTGKIIYLKSVPPVEHTAKLKVPKLVQEEAPQPVAESTVTRAEPEEIQPPQPQIIQWPLVDSPQEQFLFPAPVVTVAPTPMKMDFVSTAPPVDAETTKIDFAEVSEKAAPEPPTEPPTEQATLSAMDPFETDEASESPFDSSSQQESPFQSSLEQTSLEESSPFETTIEETTPFQSSVEEVSPFQSSAEETSPFQAPPEETSPFQTSPVESSSEQTSPFQSSPFESAPSSSPFESGNNAEINNKIDVSQSQLKSFAAPARDFAAPSTPAATVYLASNTQDGVSDLEVPQVEKNTTQEALPARVDSSVKKQDDTFRVVGHRSTELEKESTTNISKFENFNSQAAKTQSSKIILPKFKPSATGENANQYLTASTLQSGHHSDRTSDHQYETPWLSPWWMLIGLIPIALYMGTMRLFREEDEYHSRKNELFGSRLEFGGDFGEPGRSKSDAIYGRRDEVTTVRGPSGEAISLDVDTSQSSLEFAESLQFELPSSTEVAQPSFPQEIRIDQSPNFSQSRQPKMGPVRKKKGNSGKKRSKR